MREKVSSMDINAHISKLRNVQRVSEDVVRLVESDLKYGLSIAETEEYTSKRFDYSQMKVYSACLRKEYPGEVRQCIMREGLSGEQMAVALEYYEKGVPLEELEKILEDGNQTAFTMRKLLQNIMEKMKEAEDKADEKDSETLELVKQMKWIVEQIREHEQLYGAVNKKLEALEEVRKDDENKKNMEKEIREKNVMLEKQQDDLNHARASIARMKQENEDMRKEKERLERKLEEMENAQKEKELQEPQKWEAAGYYVPVMDEKGNIISHVPIQHTEQRKERSSLTALFSRLVYKRKINVVQLVAEKGLGADQLVKVRTAIEKGLSDEQLLVLIDKNIPAEQMEEIINIAVFENSQK